MATQSMTVTPSGIGIGDGTAAVLITSPEKFLYGFGVSAPTVWHLAQQQDDVWVFSTDFGKLWVKSYNDASYEVVVSIGV